MAIAAILAFAALTGCASAGEAPSPDADPDVQPAQEQAVPDFVGAWDITTLVDGGETYGESELDQLRAAGLDFFMNIDEDGTFSICIGHDGNVTFGTWAESADGNLTLTWEDGPVNVFVIDGDQGKIGSYTFKKAGRAKQAPSQADVEAAMAEAQAEASAQDDPDADGSTQDGPASDEVDPDLKAFLDSYEAIVDQYVAITQRYMAGDAAVMMDYLDMLQQYTEFAEQAESLDTDSMSNADYAYYIEVTSRCAQKLLEVM